MSEKGTTSSLRTEEAGIRVNQIPQSENRHIHSASLLSSTVYFNDKMNYKSIQ